MGAMLTHGILTAQRYHLACPRCGDAHAVADSDQFGRTIVRCGCSREAFPMPLTIGGTGAEWPVDLAGFGIDDLPEDETATRCATPDCGRAVGPRAKHCAKCCAGITTTQYPCNEPGCKRTRSFKAERCKPCARAKHRRDVCARDKEKRRVARIAREAAGTIRRRGPSLTIIGSAHE